MKNRIDHPNRPIMKKLLLLILTCLFAIPSTLKGDPAVYNLNLIKQQIYIGTFGGEDLYCAFIPNFNENDDTGMVLVRNDTTLIDQEFYLDTDEGEEFLFHFEKGTGLKVDQIPTVVQYLYKGFCIPHRSTFSVKGRNLQFVFNPLCSRYNEPVEQTDVWGWRGNRFEKISSAEKNPFKEELEMYKNRLKVGKIYEAVQNAPNPDPTGGWAPPYELYPDLFKAVHAKAMKKYRSGDKMGATTLVYWVLEQTRIQTFENEGDKLVLKFKRVNKTNEMVPSLTVSNTPENKAILTDLATILEDIHLERARALREQVGSK